MEKKAEGLSKVMIAVGKHDEASSIEKANSETINDLLRENKEPEDNDDIKPQTEFSSGIEKIIPVQPMEAPDGTGISSKMDIVYDRAGETAKPDNLLELDESKDIEILDDAVSDGVNEGVSDGVSDGVNIDEKFEWTGDTTTKIVSELEIPTPNERKELDKGWEELKNSGLDKPFVSPLTVAEELKSVNEDMDEIMKLIQETDPDAPQGEDRSLSDMLVKKREYQQVKKKE